MPEREHDTGTNHPYILESEYRSSWPRPKLSMHDYVLNESPTWANKTAVECGLTGRSYTHAQLYDGIMRFGGALQSLEAMKGAERMLREERRGPTVAILCPNCPEYPIAFYGCSVAGGTVTTINPAYTPGEVARHLKDSDTKVIVVDAILEPVVDAALGLLGKENKAFVDGVVVIVNGPSKHGRPNLRDIVADPNTPFVDIVEPPLDATAILPYSSGTTGLPKGVCLSHDAFTCTLHSYHHPSIGAMAPAEGDSQEVTLGLLPFYHIYGMIIVLSSTMAKGGKVVTMPMFEPKAFVDIIATNKVSVLHIVPPLLNFMALNPAVPVSAWSTVHTFTCSAAPVPVSTAAILKEKAAQPISFQEGYGMTETLGTHIVPKGANRLGWCGKLMSHVRAKVIDVETKEVLPSGQAGELCINSPANMKCYLNNEKATRETLDEDGWIMTGDVAVYDDEGYFKIVDRLKELIKVKGIQVSPSELEDVLLTHPGVADAGVVGVACDMAGEVPRAYVVPRSKDVKAEELQAFIAGKLARHKHLLGGVKFVEELPKNPTGKIIRRKLREMANGE